MLSVDGSGAILRAAMIAFSAPVRYSMPANRSRVLTAGKHIPDAMVGELVRAPRHRVPDHLHPREAAGSRFVTPARLVPASVHRARSRRLRDRHPALPPAAGRDQHAAL